MERRGEEADRTWILQQRVLDIIGATAVGRLVEGTSVAAASN